MNITPIRTNIVLNFPTAKGNLFTQEFYDNILKNTQFPVKAMFGEPITEGDDSSKIIGALKEDPSTDMVVVDLELYKGEIMAKIACNKAIDPTKYVAKLISKSIEPNYITCKAVKLAMVIIMEYIP